MASGTVKFFDTDRGFGFIKPDDGGNDVFFHVSELQRSGIEFVMEGDRLSYEMDKPGWVTIRINETLTIDRIGDEIGFGR